MAIRLAVLSVGAIIIASLASSTHSGLANAQQNKTSMQPSLTVEQARRIVAPLYEALNEPTNFRAHHTLFYPYVLRVRHLLQASE